MLRCWNPDPIERPSFESLVTTIKGIIETMLTIGQHQKVGLNVTYVNVGSTAQGYLYPRLNGIISTTV